jgi:hypothetical protein
MGNLITSHVPIGSLGRALMLRSAFENKHLIKGMKQLSCDVVFGSPAADCMGTGVCKISALSNMQKLKSKPNNCLSAPAILFPLEDGDGFSMLIAREMMCIKLLRSQFRGGKLRLMEPYPLPSDIVLELSLKINELQPGEYTVSEENGFFKINFR